MIKLKIFFMLLGCFLVYLTYKTIFPNYSQQKIIQKNIPYEHIIHDHI